MEALEYIIALGFIVHLVPLIIPSFMLFIGIYTTKHFKGSNSMLILIGAIIIFLLFFVNLYFNFNLMRIHNEYKNIDWILYTKSIVGLLGNLLFLIGIYRLIKQFLQERKTLPS